MEPLSAFYNSPLVVLDFQSLYPSVMVAYNYCYSTCLGRVTPFKGQYKFGVAETNLPPGLLTTLQDHITGNKNMGGSWLYISCKFTVAPNGIMYVKPEVRRGLLGRMLTELLDTRVMVKQAMKRTHDNKVSMAQFLLQGPQLFPSDPDQDTQRTPAGIKAYRQRHIWVHECNIFG